MRMPSAGLGIHDGPEDMVSAMKTRHRAGVTLLEMLTVLVVIGVMSAVVVPRLFRSQSLTMLDGDYIRLGQAIERGRKAAMKSGIRHYLSIDTTKGKWSLYKEKNGDKLLDTSADSLVFLDSLGKTIRFGFTFSAPLSVSTSKYASPTTGFNQTSPVATGLGNGFATEACVDAATPGQANWSVITFCGGATSSMESGVLYLSTNRADNRLQAILYNPNVDLHLLRFTWNGTSWRLN